MAQRRRLSMDGYGTAAMPPMEHGHFPLPPPPNGQPPARLPVGVDPNAQPQPPQQGAPQQPPAQGGMPDLSQSPEGVLIQLLQQMGNRHG